MQAWLELPATEGAAALAITPPTGAAAAGVPGLPVPLLAGISAIERPLSIPGIAPAAVSNMDATLYGAGGVGAPLVGARKGQAQGLPLLWGERPPLRRAARVVIDGVGANNHSPETVFDGIVSSVKLGASASISLEAGMERPLSDRLPLRTTAVWGGWREVQAIPWGWGKVTITPIQYDDTQRLFVLLDHPIEGVDAVTRDDAPCAAYEWRNGTDSAGHAVSFLELAEPLAEGERLAATVRGRMHPDTGRLLQSPAEVLHDVLANLIGAPVQWADFDEWRTETEGIQLGGILADASITCRAAVDAIVQSVGGAWSAAMPGIACLWPPTADEHAPAIAVTPLTAKDLQATCDATGLTTQLRVLYDYDHAAQRYLKAIELTAPEAAKEHGLLTLEWPAPWLRSPRHAEAMGQRILRYLARPRWRLTWQQAWTHAAAATPTGAWVDIAHPLAPVSGRVRLLNASLDLGSATLQCTAEAAAGDAPAITTQRLSAAFEPLLAAGIKVEFAGSEIIFTAVDENGQPLAGSRITLDDGAQVRIADAAGRVSFPVQRGKHTLLIEADGYAPMMSEVVL